MRGGLRCSRLAALAAVLLWVAAFPAAAQDSRPAGAPAASEEARPTETSTPESLSVADVPREAEAARSEIQELILASRPGEVVEKITEQLPEIEGELTSLALQLESKPPEELGLRRLVRVESDWERPRARLERWRQALDDKAAAQQAGLESLRRIGDLWRRTREGLADDEAAGAVMDRMDRLRDQVTEAEQETGAHLAQVLELQDRVIGDLERVNEALARIAAASEQASSALIVPEQPPLWRLFAETPDRPLAGDISGALIDLKNELSRFLEDNASAFAIHVLLAAGLFVSMLRLRWSSRKRAQQGPAFERASQVFGGPVAATLVVSVLLTRWIYFQPSRQILETALLVALVPLMLLLPRMVPRQWHRPLYALGALLVIGRIESLVAEQTLAERLLQLLLIGLGLAALFWLLRPGGPLAGRKDGWLLRTSQGAARIAAGLLVVALVANVAGSVALADLITEGIFLAAYVGVIFLASYLVLDVLTVVGLEWAKARSVRSVEVHAETIRGWIRWLLQLGFVVWWIYATLRAFNLREPVLGVLGDLLGRTWTAGNVSLSIGTVLAFLLTVWISVILSRIIHAVLEQDVLARVRLPRGVAATISTMARYGVITVGLLAAASAAGIELSQFAIIAGALGVGIGFGLQNLVNNFVSGLILVFERPIHVGDTVEAGNVRGKVSKIGIRSSVLRTFDGAEVIVPNGNLISSEVTNWTLSDRTRRMTVAVGVEYGTDPRKVKEVLLAAAGRHEKVASYPEPFALFIGFGGSSLDFEVRFWTSHYDDWLVIQSDVTVNIADGLAEAGIEIPFPQRDLHLRTIDAEWPVPATFKDENAKGG